MRYLYRNSRAYRAASAGHHRRAEYLQRQSLYRRMERDNQFRQIQLDIDAMIGD